LVAVLDVTPTGRRTRKSSQRNARGRVLASGPGGTIAPAAPEPKAVEGVGASVSPTVVVSRTRIHVTSTASPSSILPAGLEYGVEGEAGIVSVLTLWDTQEDLDASESAVDKLRTDAVAAFGASNLTVERYEQTLTEVGAEPPGRGSRLQIRWVKMDPALVDDNIEFFKENVLPEIRSMPGFQALRELINRATGEGAVGVIWADRDALQAADSHLQRRRDTATSRGVQFTGDAERELLFHQHALTGATNSPVSPGDSS
jgi:heme-degrading monooxygenase HmoA